jgi:hypothetical protein
MASSLDSSRRSESGQASSQRRLALCAAAALVLARGLVFVIYPNAYFDSDQAVFGLMARHLAEGRAFPLFFYGQAGFILTIF